MSREPSAHLKAVWAAFEVRPATTGFEQDDKRAAAIPVFDRVVTQVDIRLPKNEASDLTTHGAHSASISKSGR